MASPHPSSLGSGLSTPPQYRGVGVALAVGSGVFIGSSFVFKKRGLIASQRDGAAGEGVAYLKNFVWWTGMCMMIIGELMNFGAYAFTSAIIVTPLGALSVVICAVLSSIFLKEKLSLFGWIGCFQCIVGSIIVALNAPQEQSVNTITEFRHLFLAPGFLVFGSVIIVAALFIIFFVAPRYGRSSMLWYISVCSMIGGLSVSCTTGLGSCIVTSIRGENQFKNWFIYFLMAFVATTLITEIYYLNIALALFNTAMVTPTYYVMFTGCTLITTIVLYQGVKASISAILTVVFAFLIICSGITLLQISKVEPTKLRGLDRRTTLLLQAAREEVAEPEIDDPEKGLLQASEEPGLDALRGTFGVGGTIVRARRRASTLGTGSANSIHRSTSGTSRKNSRARSGHDLHHDNHAEREWENVAGKGVRRFQLTDAPVSPPATAPPAAPPPSFGLKRKKRDSHGSAVAVRGSIAGGDEAALPVEKLSLSALLAQQEWATSQRFDVSEVPPPKSGNVSPVDSQPKSINQHIHFTESTGPHPDHSASSVRLVTSSRRHHNILNPRKSIPPISQTPPLESGSTTSTSSPQKLQNSTAHQRPHIPLAAKISPEEAPGPTVEARDSTSSPLSNPLSATPQAQEGSESEDEDLVAGTITTVEPLNAPAGHSDPISESTDSSTDRSGNRALASRRHLR
ncbi:magnesium transporter NIPA-domain-containing protein [Cantharellus anzutake]|uniref:magnesium transporter NIPA-domain-containing protein n=1 Tax=Cantharellus anzutake TaxID=1750568 RepID=UPI0019049506|nr:magnesium transporter NIPA-domain-containing protein [Cantharellus anzutake]KAF8329106.1 magnesium transporter NIPA-domain-containing protein [Cantharellus anzutake]